MTEEKKRNIWFVLTIITSSVYLLWRIFFTIPWNGGVIQAAAGIILILAETVTTLGMAELMYGAKTVGSTTLITLGPYVLAALIYFAINYPASKAIEAIERRMRRGDKR